jgi:tRNA A37 threonylcarbamoyladenosine dehydratase
MDRESYLKEGLENFQNANILVVGLGGVGSLLEFLLDWSGTYDNQMVSVILQNIQNNYQLSSDYRTT